MGDYSIIYGFPFNALLKEKTNQEIGDISIKMMYSMLTVNRFYSDEITIYTDFEGMSILSILPFNFEIIYYNTIPNFKTRMLKMQYKPFLYLNENIYFKSRIVFKDNQINENGLIYVHDLPLIRQNAGIELSGLPKLNDVDSFENNIDVNYMREYIKSISDVFYCNFMEKINKKVDYK
jgi:hypothetical protein